VNVTGSRGSVARIWAQQAIDKQPITVTAEHATRYFMSMEQAVEAIIAATYEPLGHIYVPRKNELIVIGQLAKQYAEPAGVPIVVTGLRPGEVLHEQLSEKHLTPINDILFREDEAPCTSSLKLV
jgi:FlaA1/EpsC-like NDP-sugar epimerase